MRTRSGSGAVGDRNAEGARTTTPRSLGGTRRASRLTPAATILNVPDDVLMESTLDASSIVNLQLCCSSLDKQTRRAFPVLMPALRAARWLHASVAVSILRRCATNESDVAQLVALLRELCWLQAHRSLALSYDVDDERLAQLLACPPPIRIPADVALFLALGCSIEGDSPIGTLSGNFGPDFETDEDSLHRWRVSLTWTGGLNWAEPPDGPEAESDEDELEEESDEDQLDDRTLHATNNPNNPSATKMLVKASAYSSHHCFFRPACFRAHRIPSSRAPRCLSGGRIC